MKFDVVIGNPPYNNDLYLDFVQAGYDLLTDNGAMIMITPAKWQAKGGKKNDNFRNSIVPHVVKFVYYPSEYDVFTGIREQDGIMYYLIDKNIHIEKEYETICSFNKSLNSKGVRSGRIDSLYCGDILSIINKCDTGKQMNSIVGVKQSEYVSNTEHGSDTGKYPLYVGAEHNGKFVSALRSEDGLNMWKVSTSVMPVDVGFDKNGQMFGLSKTYKIPPMSVPKGSFPVLLKLQTEDEADSAISYFNTKIVRFLYLIGICGKTIADEFWRFVPDPGAFDHIFTDAELYQKYGLTQDEINIIESVIKERS